MNRPRGLLHRPGGHDAAPDLAERGALDGVRARPVGHREAGHSVASVRVRTDLHAERRDTEVRAVRGDQQDDGVAGVSDAPVHRDLLPRSAGGEHRGCDRHRGPTGRRRRGPRMNGACRGHAAGRHERAAQNRERQNRPRLRRLRSPHSSPIDPTAGRLERLTARCRSAWLIDAWRSGRCQTRRRRGCRRRGVRWQGWCPQARSMCLDTIA